MNSADRFPTRIAAPEGGALSLDAPTPSDAAELWRLVAATPSLDANSPYAYLLLCSHFAETGLVARLGGRLVGFVLGYARPDDRATAFVWQIAVCESLRGRGLGHALLDAWFGRCARAADVRFLEATVTPDNGASRALFGAFAERHGAALRECTLFPADLFPHAHASELGLRIGPLPPIRTVSPTHHQEAP